MRKDGCILIPEQPNLAKSGHHMKDHICVVCGFVDLAANDGPRYDPDSQPMMLFPTPVFSENMTSSISSVVNYTQAFATSTSTTWPWNKFGGGK